jgi:chromosome segregation ATPase
MPDEFGADALLPTPQQRLKQLTGELKRKKSEIEALTRQQGDLETDITELESTVTEVDTTLTAYGKNVKQLEKDRADLEYFLEQKTRMVAAAVQDKKEAIDRKIREYDHRIHEQDNKVRQLAEQEGEANEEFDEATRDQQAKQDAYDQAKNTEKKETDQIAALKDLKDKVTGADDQTDVASMYFLTLEMRRLIDHTHIRSQSELSERLNEALSALEDAKERARGRKAHRDALKTEQEAEAKKLADLKSGRRDEILREIRAAWPVPAAQKAPA